MTSTITQKWDAPKFVVVIIWRLQGVPSCLHEKKMTTVWGQHIEKIRRMNKFRLMKLMEKTRCGSKGVKHWGRHAQVWENVNKNMVNEDCSQLWYHGCLDRQWRLIHMLRKISSLRFLWILTKSVLFLLLISASFPDTNCSHLSLSPWSSSVKKKI